MSFVVVEKLPSADYVPGCVSLPRDCGTSAWDERPEVAVSVRPCSPVWTDWMPRRAPGKS
jgi:hypothetical protein